jgi:hypothetical protein
MDPMAFTTRWQQAQRMACAALTVAALQPGLALADPEPGRRWSTHEQNVKGLTDSQKQQLFQTRRDWELRSYDQRLALLRSQRRCLEQARTPEAFGRCQQNQRQARRVLHAQGRQVMNAEPRRLGLPLRPDHQGWRRTEQRQQKGRSWWNGPRGS